MTVTELPTQPSPEPRGTRGLLYAGCVKTFLGIFSECQTGVLTDSVQVDIFRGGCIVPLMFARFFMPRLFLFDFWAFAGSPRGCCDVCLEKPTMSGALHHYPLKMAEMVKQTR